MKMHYSEMHGVDKFKTLGYLWTCCTPVFLADCTLPSHRFVFFFSHHHVSGNWFRFPHQVTIKQEILPPLAPWYVSSLVVTSACLPHQIKLSLCMLWGHRQRAGSMFSQCFLNSSPDRQQRSTSRPDRLTSRKRAPDTRWNGLWVGYTAGVDVLGAEYLCPTFLTGWQDKMTPTRMSALAEKVSNRENLRTGKDRDNG